MEYIWTAVIIFIYLFPLVIAITRKHKNKTPIGIVTVVTGWTGLGWLVALIWSFTSNTEIV